MFLKVIVTISNQYGCGAIAIAERAARELGYQFVDRQLPVVVAKRMRISREEAKAADETGRSLGARLLSGLELSTPEVSVTTFGDTFDEEYIREVQRAVRDYAGRGNVVIVGRAAGVILGRRPDVLRVFMHAPRDWRIEHIETELSLNTRSATTEVDRIDKARHAHLRDWYGVTFGDPDLNDLAIDTSTFGVEGSAGLIVDAVRRLT
jgi:cytidylate kinase